MENSRTNNSIKNLSYAFIGQFIGILISLVSRFVFIKILTTEYLGLNGLFSNILSMLSLFELGVGPAMSFSLYKPLAENNKEKIKSLMKLYKKAYIVIGICVLVIGIALIPILPYLIDEMPDIKENISVIYTLFVLNTAISYFYTYKKSLIISDQKRYIATKYKYIFYFLLHLIQIIVLITTKNYLLFLIVQVIMTLLENISISKKTDRMYPYIKEKNIEPLLNTDKINIKKNVGAMFIHKIGGVFVNSTDNFMIAKFLGLSTVGLYSNYYLIINAINIVLSQLFSSIIASIGNLRATSTDEKVYLVFKKIYFINFWIYGFSSICLFVLCNDFITLWLGEEYLLSIYIVGILVINFYITGLRKAVLTFRDALGVYWQDRYKPIIESIINIIASIILVKQLGIFGVFLGTFISTITTCFWIEPYVLYKYGMNQKLKNYFIIYLKYSLVTIITGIITYVLASFTVGNLITTFIFKFIVSIILPNLLFYLIFYKTDEFIYFKNLFKNMLKKIKHIYIIKNE